MDIVGRRRCKETSGSIKGLERLACKIYVGAVLNLINVYHERLPWTHSFPPHPTKIEVFALTEESVKLRLSYKLVLMRTGL
jgi:hypothetical protein